MIGRITLVLLAILLLICIVIVTIRYIAGNANTKHSLGVDEYKDDLAPCASSNCIRHDSKVANGIIFPQASTTQHTRELLKEATLFLPRTLLVTENNNYLHFIQRSAIFGFIDDIEFYFHEGEEIVKFRSASRTGREDFGVNQKRILQIQEYYRNLLHPNTNQPHEK